ncbi:BTAD domain-containing putative transcriptional regulator [Micromonospora sp. RTGN7]|uniref:BTAD domain-containing putative transcriptional regulator n=1 Tax=Micromonospora sp. RTGN7 TaxID=3016526 RepID=UPI0029FF2701|nr:BTAD domain-containing putative transcriptional regulator [Micromonospora sp. RTGN7]
MNRGAVPVDLGPTKQKAVFAALALQPGRSVPLCDLQEAVWGERVPLRARQLMHTYIARLRHILEPDAPRRQRTNVIASTPTGYALRIDQGDVDLGVFRDLVGQARAGLAGGEQDRALRLFGHALHLWCDPALDELTVLLRQSVEVEALRLSWTDAAREYVVLGLRTGHPAAVRQMAARLAALEPLDEQVQAHYLTILERTGQRALALSRFGRVCELLREELGIEPGPALRAVHRRLVEPPWSPPRQAGGGAAATVAAGEVTDELVHREADARAVTELLGEYRLVTVAGPPGCGKSALARAVARRLGDRFTQGVVTVNVADLADRAQLRARIIDLLGGPPTGRAAFEARRILVLLDNAEHLVDACALMADALLRGAGGLRVLVSSREPLSLPNEVVRRLRPLAVPGDVPQCRPALAPAVDLFARRAARARPGFRITAGNIALVERICRRLDGLPLAIEYAAAGLAEGPLEGVLCRLDAPLAEFRPPADGAASPSLRAVLDRSVRTLTPAERWVFARLDSLPPVFGPAEATRLCGPYDWDAADVARVLARLEDKSLLLPEPGGPEGRRRCLTVLRRLSAELHAAEAYGVEPH